MLRNRRGGGNWREKGKERRRGEEVSGEKEGKAAGVGQTGANRCNPSLPGQGPARHPLRGD